MPKGAAREYVPGHGDRRFAVRHYDLELEYKVTTNHLAGTATLTVRALEELSELALDLFGLHVGKVTVDGRPPARYAQRDAKLVVRAFQFQRPPRRRVERDVPDRRAKATGRQGEIFERTPHEDARGVNGCVERSRRPTLSSLSLRAASMISRIATV